MTTPETDATEPQPRHDPASGQHVDRPTPDDAGHDLEHDARATRGSAREQAQADEAVEAVEAAEAREVDGERRPLGRPGDRLRVRRSVNYPAFLLTGAFVGFLLGGLIDFVGPTAVDPQTGAPVYTATSAFSTLAVMFALVGALVAAIVALVLDRRG